MLKLETVNSILQDVVGHELGVTCEVKEIYLDLGANIIGDNIVVTKPYGSTYQLLSPIELRQIKRGEFTLDDVKVLIEEMRERGW